MPESKMGTVVEANALQQKVRCDDGDEMSMMYMQGMNRLKNAKVGDRVRLTYRTGRNYGLWFGEIIPS
jgi:hypothetical protein